MKPVRKRKRVVICTALAAFLALSTVGVFGEDAAADTAQDTDMPVYAENGYENPDFDMEPVDYGDVDENPYSDEDIPVEYMSQEEQDAENNYVPTEEDKKAAEEGFAEEKKNMDEFFEEFDADSLEQLQSEDGLEMKLTAKSPVRLAATNVRATFHHMYYYYGEYLSCFSINRARAFCMMHFATHIGTYDGATESVAKAWVSRNYWKVLKVLYYGYTGPGYRYNSAWAEGYGYDRKATQATQLLLSEYYCSRYHPGTFNWLPHVNALRKYINSKPDFSEAAMSAKYDKAGTWKVYHYGSGDKIQTNWVTIKAGYYGFVHFTVPANTKLVFGRWQGKPCTKSYGAGTKLTMYNGDYFYLEMVNPKNSQPGSAYAYRDYFGAYQYKPYGYSPRGNTKQTMGQIEMSQVRMDLSLTRAPSYQVTVHKTDENGKTLTGAAFSLVSSGSTIRYSAGSTKVNGSGNVTFSGLFPGTYVLTETTVPSGYFQTTTKYTVKIADNGAVSVTKQGSDVGSASVSGRTINVKNYKNAEIAVTKKSAAKGNAPLKGTVFTLAKGGKNITTATTDANGVARFTNLTAGTYTVKETTATKGYILNNTTYTVTIARSGTKWNITWSNPKAGGGTETSTGAGKTIYNIPYATIRGIKFETGKENVKLAGAKFTLKGTGYNQNYTTKADGSFVFEGIPEGEYTLTETAPPEDHKIIQKKYHVNITWNASQGKYDYVFKKDNAEGEVVQTTASNILPYLTEENVLHIPNTKYAEFTGVKFETTENTSPTASNLTKLQGAKFSLKGEGKSLTATSNANGEFTFKGLDSGEYEFTEISPADDNHVKNTKVYTVTVTYNGDGTYTYEFKDKETGETLPSSVDGRHAFVQTGKPYIPNVKKIEFTAVKYETWDKEYVESTDEMAISFRSTDDHVYDVAYWPHTDKPVVLPNGAVVEPYTGSSVDGQDMGRDSLVPYKIWGDDEENVRRYVYAYDSESETAQIAEVHRDENQEALNEIEQGALCPLLFATEYLPVNWFERANTINLKVPHSGSVMYEGYAGFSDFRLRPIGCTRNGDQWVEEPDLTSESSEKVFPVYSDTMQMDPSEFEFAKSLNTSENNTDILEEAGTYDYAVYAKDGETVSQPSGYKMCSAEVSTGETTTSDLTRTASVHQWEQTNQSVQKNGSGEVPTIGTIVPLAGAKFTLAKTGYNQTVTSGADGKVTFTKLGPGTYTLTEITSADNHINPEREYKIKVEDVNGILEVTSIKDANGDDVPGFEETRKGIEPFVENGVLYIANKEKTKLKVVKFASWQDAEGATLSKESLHKLEGATIKLEGPNGYTAESKVTPASGEIVFEGLIPGTYTLTEEAAPNGYYSKINKYTIEVTDTGTGWAMVPKADGTLIAANVADGKRPFMVKESVEGEDVNTIYMPNVKYGELQVFKYEGIPNISETEGAVTQERVVNVTLDATLNDTSFPYLDPKTGGLKVKSITAHEATNGTTQEVQLEYTAGKGFLVPTKINGEDCDMYMVECDVNWSEEDLNTKYASWEDDNGNTYEPEGWNSKEVASSVDKSVFEANYLRDATFKLECADTGYSQTKTTAASDSALGNGYVRFEGLTPGTYTLTETVEPYKHYAEEQYKTFTVEVSETGGIYSYVIKDANGNTIDSFTQPSSTGTPGENSVSSTSGFIDGYTAYESKADMTKVPAGTIAGNYNVGQYVPLLYVPNNKLLKLNVVKQFDGEVADADINVDFILTSVKTGEKKTVQLRGTSIGTFEDLRAGEYTLKEISYMDGWTSRKMTRNLTLDRDGTVTYPDEDDNTVVVEPVVPEP